MAADGVGQSSACVPSWNRRSKRRSSSFNPGRQPHLPRSARQRASRRPEAPPPPITIIPYAKIFSGELEASEAMSTWDVEPFDNDDAADFAIELESASAEACMELVGSVLERVAKATDEDPLFSASIHR
jgi:hypothetical protein